MGLIAKFEEAAALQDLGRRTVEAYSYWLKRAYGFIKKPASQWTGPDVSKVIWEMHKLDYSAKSRKQALCALAFVFRCVLKVDMGKLELPPLPIERQTLRVIPNRDELRRIFNGLKGQCKLMAGLLYGSGLRVGECCTLRVKDIDIDALSVFIHFGKGGKSRSTVLPEMLVPTMQRHIAWRKELHEHDLANGNGFVGLPGRLAIKYKSAPREFRWQFLFPSTVVRDKYRWHITDEALAKALRIAVRSADIVKRITPHTLRHAFATHAMQCGNDIATVLELMGHEDLATTAIYVHADAASGVSPMDCAPVRPRPVTFFSQQKLA